MIKDAIRSRRDLLLSAYRPTHHSCAGERSGAERGPGATLEPGGRLEQLRLVDQYSHSKNREGQQPAPGIDLRVRDRVTQLAQYVRDASDQVLHFGRDPSANSQPVCHTDTERPGSADADSRNECSQPATPELVDGSASRSYSNAASSTSRVNTPITDNPPTDSGYGMVLTRPRWTFKPNRLQHDAGTRIEPPPSPAVANDTRPAATADALPPLDPPGVRARSHGLRVTPHVIDSVNGCIPNSGSVVLPSGIAPAARRIRTTSESCEATRVVAPVPNEVTSPARSCSSLTPNGIPSNGRVSPASSDCCAWSASRNAASALPTRRRSTPG